MPRQKKSRAKNTNTKHIFVIGGVMSSVGKGVTTASLGRILINKGYSVSIIKCEMYVNIDAGTIRPTEHGEVFVGVDGIEADQDLGNYERFTGFNHTSENYITQGQVYQEVIRRERNLEFGGEDVEVIPDIPNEIIRRIKLVGENKQTDFVIVELGGTVGEYQNLLFLEAVRMMKFAEPEQVLSLLVSYIPIPKTVGEMKTKPTQYAARTLNGAGIHPDFLVGRAEKPLDKKRKVKLSVLCNMNEDDIISAPDAGSIYEVPLILEKEGLGDGVLKKFNLRKKKNDFRAWKSLVRKIKTVDKPIEIGVVGKYFATGEYTLVDSYISVVEALRHACWNNNRKPNLHWINSEDFEKNPNAIKRLKKMDGILVPGGFGKRGIEGIIKAIKYARENQIPYFGICYGLQLAMVEYARNVLGLKKANTVEADKNTSEPVIHIMEEQVDKLKKKAYGGTMRLGNYDCIVKPKTLASQAYGVKKQSKKIQERHRHRYEVNNEYRAQFEKERMIFSGQNPKLGLVEIAELDKRIHPWFLGVQFHPEFNSLPWEPHPVFDRFIKASLKKRN